MITSSINMVKIRRKEGRKRTGVGNLVLGGPVRGVEDDYIATVSQS